MRRWVAVGVAVAVGVVAGWWGWRMHRDSPEGTSVRERELATWGLGEYLGREFPGRRVLVLGNPFTQREGVDRGVLEMEQAGLRGLRRGCGNRVAVEAEAFPELRPDAGTNPRAYFIDPETTTPLSYLVAPEGFEGAVRAHGACELVVSLIGLPVGIGEMACWRSDGPPRFALLAPDLRMVGGVEAVREAFRRGKLVACVLARPDAPGAGAPLRGEDAAEFARRFVLLTRDNFGEVERLYPGLFPRRGARRE